MIRDANDSLVVIPTAALKGIVSEAVSAALLEHAGTPALLDRAALARALTCSPAHVDNLRKKGLPTVFVGEAPRFVLSDVLAWLRQA